MRNNAGLDTEALTEHVKSGVRVKSFPGGEPVTIEEFLGTTCDVFNPAALGGMIHGDNAYLLDCRMIIEGANGPTTPKAERMLEDRGVWIIPDVLANAGGVVVSYFEWVQNLQHFRWDEREVNDKFGTIMRRSFREVHSRSRADYVSIRVAANEVGMERDIEASRTRGYL